jgi:hypothetical protein
MRVIQLGGRILFEPGQEKMWRAIAMASPAFVLRVGGISLDSIDGAAQVR